MNNKFKFRMYDTNVNKMYIPNDFEEVECVYECIKQQINWDLDVDYDVKFNHLEDGRFFMQCTGLKDKNGKLIYEGDIINCFDCRPCSRSFPLVEKGIITYKKAQFIVNTKFTEYLFEDIEDIEIIGNIYENKELLGGAEDE